MTRALLRALLCGAMALGARRAAAQVVDTASKGSEPAAAMLTPATVDAGRKIFHGKGSCSGCHGGKLQGGPIAPALTGPSYSIHALSGGGFTDHFDGYGVHLYEISP